MPFFQSKIPHFSRPLHFMTGAKFNIDSTPTRFTEKMRQTRGLFIPQMTNLIHEYSSLLQKNLSKEPSLILPSKLFVELPFFVTYDLVEGCVGIVTVSFTNKEDNDFPFSTSNEDFMMTCGFCRIFEVDNENNQLGIERDSSASYWSHSKKPRDMVFVGENTIRELPYDFNHTFATFEVRMYNFDTSPTLIEKNAKEIFENFYDSLGLEPFFFSPTRAFRVPFLGKQAFDVN